MSCTDLQPAGVNSAAAGSIRFSGVTIEATSLSVSNDGESAIRDGASCSFFFRSSAPSYMLVEPASTVMIWPARNFFMAPLRPTMAGTPNSRAIIAMWPMGEPISVTMAAARVMILENAGEE